VIFPVSLNILFRNFISFNVPSPQISLSLLKPFVLSQAAFSSGRSNERIEFFFWEGLTHPQDFVPIIITAEKFDPELFYNADFDSSIIFKVFHILLQPPIEILCDDVKKQFSFLRELQFLNDSSRIRNKISGSEN
jgi:hypothetical protein